MPCALCPQNAVIAVMGDSYERVKDSERAETLRGKALVVREFMANISSKKLAQLEADTCWIHMLELKKSQTEMDTGEWGGRLQAVRTVVNGAVCGMATRSEMNAMKTEMQKSLVDEMKKCQDEMKKSQDEIKKLINALAAQGQAVTPVNT